MRVLLILTMLFSSTVLSQSAEQNQALQLMRQLVVRADTHQNNGDYSESEAVRRQLISLMEQVNFPPPEIARQLSNLASVLNLGGNPEEAQELCERALSILEQFPTNDPVQEAVLHGNLANALRLQGSLTQARTSYEEELSLLADIGLSETHFAASATVGIGAIEAELGNFQQAKEFYETALPIFLEISDESHPTTARFIAEYEAILQQLEN